MSKVIEHSIIRVKKYNEGSHGNEVLENRDVVRAVKTLADIKQAMDMLEEAADEARQTIAAFHFATGARQFDVDGLGRVDCYLGSSTRFDKAKAAVLLVEQGVSSGLVERVWGAASKSSVNSKPTVRFTKEK